MTVPEVVLRGRTDADTDTLFELAADLATWEQRNPEPPTVLSRATFDKRLAERDETRMVSFVIDVDAAAVGNASMFEFDPLAQHASVGIGLTAASRGRGIGTEAMRQLVDFGFVASEPAAPAPDRRGLQHSRRTQLREGRVRARGAAARALLGERRVDHELRMGLLRSEWTGRQ